MIVSWLKYHCILVLLVVVLSVGSLHVVASPTLSKIPGMQSATALLFTENKGQVMDASGKPRPDILFTAHSAGALLFITAAGINYQFTKTTYPEGYDRRHPDPIKQADLEKQIRKETYRFSLTLAGANPHPAVSKEGKSVYYENFYTTDCLEGITNVGTYEKIVCKDVYPHIDWVVYSNGNKLKYDFLVHPGGDANKIKLKIDDAQNVQITRGGELLMENMLGEVREQTPVSYADDREVKTIFKQNDDGSIGFDVEQHDGKELRIDPSVVWATYDGGAGIERLNSVAIDSTGNVFATGTTQSTNGIAAGGYQLTYGGGAFDAFVVKFDASGNRLWGTYYGGSGDDGGESCATDANGDLYMAGWTGSAGLASSGAFQTTYNGPGSAGLLLKLDPAGARLWATYYGGDNYTYGYGCRTDAAGSIYMVGYTASYTGIATSAAYRSAYGSGDDGFLVRFNSVGNRQWGTYYGGSGYDHLYSITIDSAQNIYVAGETSSSTGIASANAFQPNYFAGVDAFLARFDTLGNCRWGSYYGGEGVESIYSNCLAADAKGNIYMAGFTNSQLNIATSGAFQSTLLPTTSANSAAFLVKFNSSGFRQWGTYYAVFAGGGQLGFGLAAIGAGGVYLSGYTSLTTGMTTIGAYQMAYGGGGFDGLITKFDSAGVRKWATYYGGANDDGFSSCVTDRYSNLYLAGYTYSTSHIATTGAYQTTYGGGNGDGMLIKFLDAPVITTTVLSGTALCPGSIITIRSAVSASFNAPNIFTVELSDTSGSFASPVILGTHALTASNIFTYTIPVSTPPGTHYRIRTLSSDLPTIGKDNGVDIVITAAVDTPVFALGPVSMRCSTADSIAYMATASNSTSIYYSLDAVTSAYPGNSIDPTTGVVTYAAGWSGTTIITATAYGCNDHIDAIHTVTTGVLSIAAPVADSPNVVCVGSKLRLRTVTDTSYHYQWRLNGTDITGAASPIYDASTSGSYDVVINTSSGCVTISAQLQLNLQQVTPPDPGIFPVVTQLCVTPMYNDAYQWYLNGIAVPGQTGPCIAPVHDGAYTVKETNNEGCATISPAYITDLAVGAFERKEIIIYPDPVINRFIINTPEPVNASIWNIEGKLLMVLNGATTGDIGQLPDAVYIVKVYDKNNSLITVKLVIKAD